MRILYGFIYRAVLELANGDTVSLVVGQPREMSEAELEPYWTEYGAVIAAQDGTTPKEIRFSLVYEQGPVASLDPGEQN